MRASLLALLSLSAACAVDKVEMRAARRGPVAAVGFVDAGGGHVRYPLGGGEWVVRRRRKRALRVMAKHCRGAKFVSIRREFSSEDVEAPFHAGGLDADKLVGDERHYKVDAYRHMVFECRKP